ncbi:epi-inositol hydrolase [Cutibacterium acnes JCM 18916]|nr:epi-inositol hydrolase [Cutibacterium acnes JCM 18916]
MAGPRYRPAPAASGGRLKGVIMTEQTVRLSVGQAIVRYLTHQYTERDGVERRFIRGVFGIFGHGNATGLGQALLQNEAAPDDEEGRLEYWMGRNEQGMVHACSAYARATNRLQALAATASIGPGSLNMVTGAALATTNRVPVLLFPSDIFANRAPDPVLQQLEDPTNPDVSCNDAFRPVSKFWDRVNRPEQLMVSLPRAMRVLTDPVDTGAAVICLPEDVQTEVYDWPVSFFAKKVWYIDRRLPDRALWCVQRKPSVPHAVHSSFLVEARSIPRPARSCGTSHLLPASRSPTPRRGKVQSIGIIRAPLVALVRLVPTQRMRWRPRPTSSSASARGTPISPPVRRRPLKIRT